MAKKTIEFRNFRNAQVPLEIVAGHLTMDLKPKTRFCTSETVDATDCGNRHVRDRRLQFLDRLQKTLVWTPHLSPGASVSSGAQLAVKGSGGDKLDAVSKKHWFGLIIYHPSCCHDSHTTKGLWTITKLTQLTVKWMSRVFTFKPRVHQTIWAYGVYW